MKRTLAILSTAGLLLCATAARAQMLWQLENETYNSVTYRFQGLPASWLTGDHMVDWSVSQSYVGDVTAAAAPGAGFGAPYPTLGMQRAGGGIGFATENNLNGPLIVGWALDLSPATLGSGGYQYDVGTENLDGFALPISGTSSWVTLFPDATKPFGVVIEGTTYNGTATYSSMGADQDHNGDFFGIATYSIPTLPPVPEPSSVAFFGLGVAGWALLRRRNRA